jgi:hypothetical protein
VLARARGEGDDVELGTLAELSRLQPLVLERVRALSLRDRGELGQRAAQVAAVLTRGGIARDNAEARAMRVRPLPSELITGELKHPLARGDSAFIGKLQALLALVPSPDPAHLRDYCEKLSPAGYAAAAQAVEQATLALGVTGVEAYVSRGSKAIGVRAYEHAPPFVLIGGRHLDAGDPLFLTPPELLFALATEIAHVRFGHTRVTQSEVWAGTLSKTKEGLEVLLSVLPALKGLRFAERAHRLAGRLPLSWMLERATRLATRLQADTAHQSSPTGNDHVLSRINEELVAAHRLMQLTADRAGLLLAGDVRAAVRAMLLVRKDYTELLDAMEQRGMGDVLGQKNTRGEMAHQHLAVRMAALFAFFLSDEFARLRRELNAAE